MKTKTTSKRSKAPAGLTEIAMTPCMEERLLKDRKGNFYTQGRNWHRQNWGRPRHTPIEFVRIWLIAAFIPIDSKIAELLRPITDPLLSAWEKACKQPRRAR